MKVTVHAKLTGEPSFDRRWEGTRADIYELKIELEENAEPPHRERIEIAHAGVCYRLEPRGDGFAISTVGVPLARLVVCPQSANTIIVSGLQRRPRSRMPKRIGAQVLIGELRQKGQMGSQ